VKNAAAMKSEKYDLSERLLNFAASVIRLTVGLMIISLRGTLPAN